MATPSVNSPCSHKVSSREVDGRMEMLPLGFAGSALAKGRAVARLRTVIKINRIGMAQRLTADVAGSNPCVGLIDRFWLPAFVEETGGCDAVGVTGVVRFGDVH